MRPIINWHNRTDNCCHNESWTLSHGVKTLPWVGVAYVAGPILSLAGLALVLAQHDSQWGPKLRSRQVVHLSKHAHEGVMIFSLIRAVMAARARDYLGTMLFAGHAFISYLFVRQASHRLRRQGPIAPERDVRANDWGNGHRLGR